MLRRVLAVAAIVCSMGLASQAAALDTTSTEFLGSYTPPEPASPTDEVNYINTLIDQALGSTNTVDGVTYVRSNNLCGGGACPDAVVTGATKEDPTDGSIDVTGFTYLVGKYDGPNGGALVWYVGDLSGVQSIPTNFFDCGKGGTCGLSHMSLYGPTSVPEPGTLLLVGTGLVAVGLWRRRR